jgi:hypothetical protein
MTTLPATIDSEETMVDVVTHWIDLVAEMLKSETARLYLRAHIRGMLKQGTVSTLKVIEAARAGHAEADFALRELAVEMLDCGEMPPALLRAYVQEALVRAPVTYPAGVNIVDYWMRDIGIAVMVELTMLHWPLRATRNRVSKRPSASTIVSRALSKRGHIIGEWQVERIFSNHHKLAERLSASIPLH